jgi:hypothetical protein
MSPSPDRRRPPAADPGRASDRERAARNVAGQLSRRGIDLTGTEDPDELVTMLEAVERFEAAVRAHGGDSFTNAPDSGDPDDPTLVLPARRRGESAETYAGRIRAAAARLSRRAD